MNIIRAGSKSKAVPVSLLETANITLEDIPDTSNPGDEITPKVTVKRQDGTTPIPGAKVTFFIKDSQGSSLLGTTGVTDSNGQAVADQSYFVPDTEEGKNLVFTVVIWPKVI
jgi:hypothetical protein